MSCVMEQHKAVDTHSDHDRVSPGRLHRLQYVEKSIPITPAQYVRLNKEHHMVELKTSSCLVSLIKQFQDVSEMRMNDAMTCKQIADTKTEFKSTDSELSDVADSFLDLLEEIIEDTLAVDHGEKCDEIESLMTELCKLTAETFEEAETAM